MKVEMKVVYTLTKEQFESSGFQSVVNDIKSGTFQRQMMDSEKSDVKFKKVTATINIIEP